MHTRFLLEEFKVANARLLYILKTDGKSRSTCIQVRTGLIFETIDITS